MPGQKTAVSGANSAEKYRLRLKDVAEIGAAKRTGGSSTASAGVWCIPIIRSRPKLDRQTTVEAGGRF